MHVRKLFALPVLAAGLLAALPALAGDLEDGLKLKAAGKFAEALPKLEKAHEADPKAADAALALSEVLVGLGKYEKGARVLIDAVTAHPDDVRLLVQRARAYLLEAQRLDAGREDPNMILSYAADADRWAKEALAKDAKNVEARVIRAKVTAYQGADADKVIEAFDEIVKEAPQSFDARWELAQAHWRAAYKAQKDKNKWVAAEMNFREAFKIDPKSGEALLWATWAKAWQQLPGSTSELIQDYAAAAKLLPNDERPLSNLWRLRKQKDAAPAVREAFEGLAKDAAQTRAKAFVALLDGEKAVADGKGDAAASAFAKAAELYPAGSEGKDAYLAVYAGAIQAKGLDNDQREKIAEAAWKRWPGRSEIPNDYALMNRDTFHDYKRSLKWYLRAAEAAPSSPRVLNDTGLIYHYHMNDLEKAEPWYRKAIAAAQEQGIEPSNDPTNEGMGFRDALNNTAKILMAQKRWKELRALAKDDVPEGFPGREQWLEAGDK